MRKQISQNIYTANYYGWKNVTKVYWWNKLVKPKYSIVVNQGGSRSSKTRSILQNIFDELVLNPNYKCTCTGQDRPNLRKGAQWDFQCLLNENPEMMMWLKNPDSKSGIYEFFNGSILEFTIFKTPQDARAGTRHILFVNEANGLPYEIFFELELRTLIRTYIDYNPSSLFWAHKELIPNKEKVFFIRSTFKDNSFCPPKQVAAIKSYYIDWRRTGSSYYQNKWLVYGLGLTGLIEGAVIQNYEIVDRFPDRNKDLTDFGYGIDWGYIDPLAIGRNGIQHNGRLVTQQVLYESGIRFYALDWLMPKLGIKKNDPLIADTGGVGVDAIPWLQSKGWNITGATKGPGSVKAGNQLLNEMGIDLVQGSDQFLKEYGSYIYLKKDGKYDKDLPTDKDNHGVDQLRYFARWAALGQGVDTKSGHIGAGSAAANSQDTEYTTRTGLIV